MNNSNTVDQAEARRMSDAAMARAKEMGKPFSIAICDTGGYPVSLVRMDGAGLLTAQVASQKARTSALLRAPSSVLADRIGGNPALLRLEEYLPMPGGLPIVVDGTVIGAIGISGGTDADDVAIGEAGLAAL